MLRFRFGGFQIFVDNSYCLHRSCTRFFSYSGKASPEATKLFVTKSSFGLHHKFHNSEIYINPIIHGPPPGIGVGTNAAADRLIVNAVVKHRRNCIYVYNRLQNEGLWHSSDLKLLFQDFGISREQIVTVAGLGRPVSIQNAISNLEDALKVCNLDHIDIVIFECDRATFTVEYSEFQEVIEVFNNLVVDGKILAYGLSIDVPPYNYHTPTKAGSEGTMMLPMVIEQCVSSMMPGLDLILYPISPTTQTPATYSMLSPDPASGTGIDDDEQSLEEERLFTRGAINPLFCFVGEGNATTKDSAQGPPEVDGSASEETDNFSADQREMMVPMVSGVLDPQLEDALGQALDRLCPPLRSSSSLQEKAMRVVMSVGVEVLVLDSVTSNAVGNLSVKPEDALLASDTTEIFGTFMLPKDDIATLWKS